MNKNRSFSHFWYTVIFVLFVNFAQGQEPVASKPNKTVFLTGAAGFIGSNFLQYMFDKYPDYHFVVLDALTYAGMLERIPSSIQTSDRFQFIHGNILDKETVDQIMASSQLVVHFAAESHVSRSIADDFVFFETDVLGTKVLMESLVKHKKTVERFIHISTSEVYGTADYEPMDENHPLNPRSPYAAAKAGADRLVYSYICTYEVPAMIIRSFNVYGAAQHLEKMIPRFISNAIEQQSLTIQGSGEQKRDWVHTKDICNALDKALHIPDFSTIKGEVINIGTGIPISVLEIANLILDQFGLSKDFLTFMTDRPGQVMCHISSVEKAKNLLNWAPTMTLEEGIKKTIEWYIQNPSIWEKMKKDMLTKVQIEDNDIEL